MMQLLLQDTKARFSRALSESTAANTSNGQTDRSQTTSGFYSDLSKSRKPKVVKSKHFNKQVKYQARIVAKVKSYRGAQIDEGEFIDADTLL